jgi:hypothetical protein
MEYYACSIVKRAEEVGIDNVAETCKRLTTFKLFSHWFFCSLGRAIREIKAKERPEARGAQDEVSPNEVNPEEVSPDEVSSDEVSPDEAAQNEVAQDKWTQAEGIIAGSLEKMELV